MSASKNPSDLKTGVAPLKFSLAGVQLKFSLLGLKRGGFSFSVNGQGKHWIVKCPSMHYEGVPENEYSMMSLAKKLGLNIPEMGLVRIKDLHDLPDNLLHLQNQEGFIIERFDRTEAGIKIHIEDFAQIFSVYPEEKYSSANYRNIAQVLALRTSETSVREYIRRLIFNLLIGNMDSHVKNWSPIYKDPLQPELSPGYDFVSTILHIPDSSLALKFFKNKTVEEWTWGNLKRFAQKSGLSETLVLYEAKTLLEKFHTIAPSELRHLPLSQPQRERILMHARAVPISQENAP